MKGERLHEGTRITLPVPKGHKAGWFHNFSSLKGILATDEGGGGNPPGFASVWRAGCFTVLCDEAITQIGTVISWNPVTKKYVAEWAAGVEEVGISICNSEGKNGTKAVGPGYIHVILKPF